MAIHNDQPETLSRRLAGGLLAVVLLTSLTGHAAAGDAGASGRLHALLVRAEALEPLRTVLVARGGEVIAERGYRGYGADEPANIKSVSKSIVSALVGLAIQRGVLEGVDQPIAPLLAESLPPDPDPRLRDVTVGHLLSMQAGLARTSGGNYGPWTASDDWVRWALARPFVEEPGGRMQYSTGSTHLLSAILTRAAGRSTLALARDWLGPLDGFRILHWQRDPQGIYFGGNQMTMTPRSLLAFGELYRRGGVTAAGERLLAQRWIEQSWQPRTRSRFTGDAYGYGWFIRTMAGQQVYYAWGYGGQMLFVVPGLALTAVMTSSADEPSGRTGHRADLLRLMAAIVGETASAG